MSRTAVRRPAKVAAPPKSVRRPPPKGEQKKMSKELTKHEDESYGGHSADSGGSQKNMIRWCLFVDVMKTCLGRAESPEMARDKATGAVAAFDALFSPKPAPAPTPAAKS